jgi:murein DD-endopeptidase MepM/ murein hydrolase activator NlpD/urea transporter
VRPDRPATVRVPAAIEGAFAAYGAVLFSGRRLPAALALLATLVVPEVGLPGLVGALGGSALAQMLGYDRDAVRAGVYGYNPMLVGLYAGASVDPPSAALTLALVLALPTVLLHAAILGALSSTVRLPPLSLPFLFTGWGTTQMIPLLQGGGPAQGPPVALLGWPDAGFAGEALRALGAIYAVPNPLSGVMVLGALAAASRISLVHAAAALFAVTLLMDHALALPPRWLAGWGGWNAILAAVALGGVFCVPSPGSLALAMVAALLCALLDASIVRPLSLLGLPPLVLSMNVVVLGTILALRGRVAAKEPLLVAFVPASPEEGLHHFRTRVERFRAVLAARLRLPFRGPWVVTQGNDGAHTHQGPQRYGLDFEVADASGRRYTGDGTQLVDWLCYKLPVLAPAAGTVVRAVDGFPDNTIGQVDTVHPYGNHVVVAHAAGLYTLLGHLSPGTLAVREGQAVAVGQVLGRVGNSGRSPVPHLHVQAQAKPEAGAPSVPIEFSDVVEDGEARLLPILVPREGGRLRNAVRSEALAGALLLAPGSVLHAVVRVGGRVHHEVLTSEVDALGNRSLTTSLGADRLWFGDERGSFVVYDHRGPRDRALWAFYAALARVPLEDHPGLQWEDRLDPHRLGSASAEWARDLLSAVVPPPRQRFRYITREDGGELVIEGRAEGRSLRAVESVARIRRGVGLRVVETRVVQHHVRVEIEAAP